MNISDLDAFDLDQLERLHEKYSARQDSASAETVRSAMAAKGAVQTPDMADCGRLYAKVIQLDPSGCNTRPAVSFTGDFRAAYGAFMQPGINCLIDSRQFSGANSQAARARGRTP